MSYLNFILLVSIFGLGLMGCSTPTLQVTSQPENAEVSVISKEKAPIKIGKTPISINNQNFPQILSDSFQVQIEKDGFAPQSVLVPKLSQLGAEGKINFNMENQALPKYCQAQEQSLNDVARGVAEASNLIQLKKFSEANTLVQALVSKFDSVSVLYDIQGNIFFLQKNFNRALESYKKSNTIDPSNAATLRMIKKIEQLQGQGA